MQIIKRNKQYYKNRSCEILHCLLFKMKRNGDDIDLQ